MKTLISFLLAAILTTVALTQAVNAVEAFGQAQQNIGRQMFRPAPAPAINYARMLK